MPPTALRHFPLETVLPWVVIGPVIGLLFMRQLAFGRDDAAKCAT